MWARTVGGNLKKRRTAVLAAITAAAVVVVACGNSTGSTPSRADTTAAPGASSTTVVPSATPFLTPGDALGTVDEISPAERAFANRARNQGWLTDFTKIDEDLDVGDIFSGGVPRDGIPSIDNPRFAPVSDAPTYLRDEEPVVFVVIDGAARAYPLSILTWHEIVNDELAGQPITVTFCPLCNTAIAFPRTFEGEVLDFGVSGNLIFSNLIMYDRQTQSWWVQATGKGIAGTHAGKQLEFVPATIASWSNFTAQFPDGDVLRRPTSGDRHPVTGRPIARNYDRPPYTGYDSIDSSPFLFDGPFDGRLRPMDRVAAISLNDVDIAYPFAFLAENSVINDAIGGIPVVTFFDNGTESAFQSRSGDFAKSGSTTIFERTADGRALTFTAANGVIKDDETGSIWTKFGIATDGELAGTELKAVVHQAHFWFSWAAFSPDTEVRASLDQLTE